MRLRPSGTQGPIASSLAAFRRYHDEAGLDLGAHGADARPRRRRDRRRWRDTVDGEVARRADAAARPRPAGRRRRRHAPAHRRAASRRPPLWEVKHRRGGLVDIEFIAQYLQLRDAAHASRRAAARTRSAALRRCAAAARSARSRRRRCSRALDAVAQRAGPAEAHASRSRSTEATPRRRSRRCSRAAPARLTSPRSKRIWSAAAARGARAATSASSQRRPRRRDRAASARGGASTMSLETGDKAPDFTLPTDGGGSVTPVEAQGQEGRALFLSQGRHLRLHRRGLRLPRHASPISARSTRR